MIINRSPAQQVQASESKDKVELYDRKYIVAEVAMLQFLVDQLECAHALPVQNLRFSIGSSSQKYPFTLVFRIHTPETSGYTHDNRSLPTIISNISGVKGVRS